MNDPELNIALEKDTLNRLEALRDIIPEEIATQLYAKLPSPGSGSPSGSPAPQSVPYSLLRAVSRWARTDAGRDALLAHQPPLDARDYDMIALLAGSTTSPEKHFPVPVGGWPQDERDRRREISDRKAVTNVVNALLSIGGCGVATWYAAGAAGWNNEWVRPSATTSRRLGGTRHGLLTCNTFLILFTLHSASYRGYLHQCSSPSQKPCFTSSGRRRRHLPARSPGSGSSASLQFLGTFHWILRSHLTRQPRGAMRQARIQTGCAIV